MVFDGGGDGCVGVRDGRAFGGELLGDADLEAAAFSAQAPTELSPVANLEEAAEGGVELVGVENVVETEGPRDDDPVEGLIVVEHEEGVDVVHFGVGGRCVFRL